MISSRVSDNSFPLSVNYIKQIMISGFEILFSLPGPFSLELKAENTDSSLEVWRKQKVYKNTERKKTRTKTK